MEPYELIVPGDTRSLSLIRMVVTAVAREAGLDQDEVGRVEVAVDEACTNVIEHGYGELERQPPVEIVLHTQDKDFVVDVLDTGPSFEFERSAIPRFPEHWTEEDHTRGAGLYLMMSLMDSVEYERLPDERNRMRMIKRLEVTKE